MRLSRCREDRPPESRFPHRIPPSSERFRPGGTGLRQAPLMPHESIRGVMEATMMKGGLLWLIGIPLPIILILFFLGYLH
ncbi:hypothetical protein [Methylobacterium frigidaeris]|uniref:Uncharacterized protein n=1 Tax=Methylobacterium frigidaeris TaxID=2038277 RepID=A0AA37HCR5_9HYPH|nr:hypothetical protein [Methylobacterium frigidaeris]GJD63169.1 hypothetical protein MPEAHAMD_3332 [Methylobacterium frigidaeris]